MARKTTPGRKPGPAGNMDYVEPGSDLHAAILGLKKAEDGDAYTHQGWALVDTTAFGPQATPAYIAEVLRQKVSELTSPLPEIQSDDPWAPGYAPPMIDPRPDLATA